MGECALSECVENGANDVTVELSRTHPDTSSWVVALIPKIEYVKSRGRLEEAGVWYEAQSIREHIVHGEECSVIDIDKYRCSLWGVGLLGHVEPHMHHQNSVEDDLEQQHPSWLDIESKKTQAYLRSLDPTEWKDQDHYRVLGLSSLRYQAEDYQIKFAYRQKVLLHHPDKRRHRGETVVSGDNDYFTNITRAFETLSSMEKKRAYDSVDPKFDNSVPSQPFKPETFFDTFGPVFERNARWSMHQPVPLLGDLKSTFDDVNSFYNFWFDFRTWREYSYEDEEDKEKGEDRFERRYIEKLNREERDKKRKEEVRRIRGLVQSAFDADPRISMFKENERKEKERIKAHKQEEIKRKKKAEENARLEEKEAIRVRKEEEDKAMKEKQDEHKRERDLKKKQLQKERKALHNFCKDHNYFSSDDLERITRLEQVDKLCKLLPIEELQVLNSNLLNNNNAQEVLLQEINSLNAKIERELSEQIIQHDSKKSDNTKNNRGVIWSDDETQLLVKASTLFPVGTKSRWEVIANFINEHRTNGENKRCKTAKDVISKVRDLQKMDASAKTCQTDGGAFESFLQANKKAAGVNKDANLEPSEAEPISGPVWSEDEQKLLEQALKTFNASVPDRWSRIAECVPDKSKKDCIKRYKELAELVKAKKAALQKSKETT